MKKTLKRKHQTIGKPNNLKGFGWKKETKMFNEENQS
jgi:hypothetical protein